MALDDVCGTVLDSGEKCNHTSRYHNQWDGCTFKIEAASHCPCSKFIDKFAMPEDANLDEFLNGIHAEMAKLNEMFAPLKNELNAAKQSIADIEAARKIAIEQANKVEAQLKDYEANLKAAERASDLANRRKAQEEAIKQAEADLLRLSDEFDRITKNMPWKAWAYDFQIKDAKIMALGKRVIVGNTMGTGKTLTSQIACDMLKAEKVLVFTPATVMRTFVNEIRRWAPHRNVILMGGMNKEARRGTVTILQTLPSFTVVLNYEAMRKDSAFIDELKSLEFDTVILDEAHNFKDKKSLTFRQVKQVTENIPNCFPMTGSPILNKPQDLWPLLNIIDNYMFYSENSFLDQYCVQDWETKKWQFTTTGLDGLQRKLRDKFIRRTKDQTGIALPEKTIQVHDILLNKEEHARQYAANLTLNKQAAIFLQDDSKAMNITSVLALITRKRQMMTLPNGMIWKDSDKESPTFGQVIFQCDVEESVKLDYIIKPNGDSDKPSYDEPGGLLPELVSDEKVVIFSQFKATLHELAKRCKAAGISAAIIDGDVPMARRQEIIDTFQNSPIGAGGGIDVIIGNFKALGVGVTLHAASQMIILDEEWSPGKNEQAYDRIHRFGQEKAVTIHILRVQDSIDTWMADLIDEKQEMVSGFNSSIDLSDRLKKLFGEEGKETE